MKYYARGRHTVYYHRYHLGWITNYRYQVLTRPMKARLRERVAQVAEELGVTIENGVVSSDPIPTGRSSRKVQQEFPELRKRYWGRHCWARGYFSATSGKVTDDLINEYLDNHSDAHEPQHASRIRLE